MMVMNDLLRYGAIFIIIFLSLILIWKISEWMRKLIWYIKLNPTILDPNLVKENYMNIVTKTTKIIVDKTPSYDSQNERRKGGIKIVIMGLVLIILYIISIIIRK